MWRKLVIHVGKAFEFYALFMSDYLWRAGMNTKWHPCGDGNYLCQNNKKIAFQICSSSVRMPFRSDCIHCSSSSWSIAGAYSKKVTRVCHHSRFTFSTFRIIWLIIKSLSVVIGGFRSLFPLANRESNFYLYLFIDVSEIKVLWVSPYGLISITP